MNGKCLLAAWVLVFGLTGCSDSSSSAPIKKAVIAPQLEMTEEVARLLELAKGAEADIAKLRKSKFEISDSTGLPSEKNRPGEIDWFQRMSDLRSRELAVYQQRSQDPPERKAIAEKFLQQYFQMTVGRLADSKPLIAMGLSIAAGGTQDPLVETYALSIQDFPAQANELSKFRDRLVAINERIPEADRGMIYDLTIRRMLVRVGVWNVEGYQKTPMHEQEMRVRDLIKSLIRFLELNSEPQYLHTTWRLSHQFADVLETNQREDFHRRIVQSVAAPDWYKLNAAAIVLFDEGWGARGKGFASTVTEEGWAVLNEKLEQARRLSLLAWKMNPESPIPTAKLEQLVAAGAKDEWDMQQWFRVSTEAQFDQYDAYSIYLNFIQPNWGGSLRGMCLFSGELLRTGRVDTQVPEVGLNQLWELRVQSKYFVMQNPELNEALSLFVERALQAIQHQELIHTDLARWNGFVLTLLLDAKNYPLAKRWYENCGYVFDEQTMDQSGGRLSRAIQIMTACTGPGSELAIPLVDALYGRSIPQPSDLASLREKVAALRTQDSQESTEKLCREMDLVIDQYETFESGAWVELRFTPDMPGWDSVTSDKWIVDDEQTIRMQSRRASYLMPVARFTPPYMVESDLQFFDPTGATENTAAFLDAGLDWYPEAIENPISAKIIVHANLQDAYGIINGDATHGFSFGKADSRHLRLKIWPEEVECSADGMILYQLATQGHLLKRILIGAPPYFPANTAYQFHRIRVRKIPYEAVSPVPWPEMAEYGQRVIAFDPADPEGYVYRGSGLARHGDPLEAIATLESGLKNTSQIVGIVVQLPQLYLLTGRVHDAWESCQQAEKLGDTLNTAAIRAMLLACIDDPALRNPPAALELAKKYPNPKSWQTISALALAHASNGNMEEARSFIEHARQLKNGPVVEELLSSWAKSISQGEVPVLQNRSPEK